MKNYKDELSKLVNQMNREIATESATPEENKLKKEYGRIFETNHCTRRLAERNLEIPRDIIRKRLPELKRVSAALFFSENMTLILIEPINKKDWIAKTVYQVKELADAQRKTQKRGTQLLIFN